MSCVCVYEINVGSPTHWRIYRKMYWGILMVPPQSAAAAGPKKNRTDTCTAPVSFLKKKMTSVAFIIIRIYGHTGNVGLKRGRSIMNVLYCLIPVTMI